MTLKMSLIFRKFKHLTDLGNCTFCYKSERSMYAFVQ